jgi:nucleoside phosphorylase/CheY-like chemotaxis protein
MKILFVDDDNRKIKTIAPILKDRCGIDQDCIHVSYDAMQARQALGETKFDLMILDLLLPLRAVDDPDVRHSTDLLREIVLESDLRKPSMILGITRDMNARIAAEPLFQDHLWTVIEVNETSDEWTQRIVNCVRYLKAGEERSPEAKEYKIDVAILTALPSPELEAVHCLPWEWDVERPLDRTTMVRKGNFKSGGKTFSVVCAAAPRMGMTATAILATKIIAIERPRFVLMTGICAGVEGRVSLGDIVFADPCWDYQSGKHVRDSDGGARFAIAPHQLSVSEAIRTRADQLRRDKSVWRSIEDGWQLPKPSQLNMHIGPLASGSAVIADETQVEQIMTQQRQLLGIEMEAYGLFAAAQSADTPKPTAFAMKSVCDFANSRKDDSAQPYAAYTSAQAARVFLERYMHEIAEFAGD